MGGGKSKISIITPVYNPGELFPACLDSLETQTIFDQIEIVLVDAETGMVRAVRHAPLSVSFSRKLCASVARQYNDRYIASWNEEDFQKRCLKVYEEYPESGDISRAPGCILCQAAPPREDDADGEAGTSGDGDD